MLVEINHARKDSTSSKDCVGSICSIACRAQAIDNCDHKLYQRIGKQIWIGATINGKGILCQWDTGSTYSMVGLDGYRQLGSPHCRAMETTLQVYGGIKLEIKDQCFVHVKLDGETAQKLKLVVANEERGRLLTYLG
ncbi:unnamed protein product [Clavelina lepadiformis]|uniref:Uncharacterized protein n=1 Tax=Clavelina lepadiformis TaxID=159417 RepID=A0ABP0FMY8_CLALP